MRLSVCLLPQGFVYGALCAATVAVLGCRLYIGWAARR